MSVVYLAQQERPSRYVAVKILLPTAPMGSSLHNEFLARFQYEADIIARLEHIHIIPIFECNEQEGLAYLVMPYLTGGSLRDLLARRGPFSLHETMTYIEQAAGALDYAHAHGVIHRDLKPGNFLLHADGRLVLADFGIARIVQGNTTLTNTGILLGTPNYMAPEMALGRQIDQRTDTYELGIVLFQMLSGDVPFKGRTAFEVIEKHLEQLPPLLHQINSRIPSTVDTVVRKATAKRPDDRYESAGALAQALRHAITTPFYPSAVISPLIPRFLSSEASLSTLYATNLIHEQSTTQAIDEKPPSHSTISLNVPRRTRRWPLYIGIAILFMALLLGGISLYLMVSGAPQAPPSSGRLASDEAKATVQRYYDFWNQGDYPDAYNLLASTYQQNHSYDSLFDSYVYTKHASIQFVSVTPSSDGGYIVRIIDTATEENTDGTSVQRVYQGFYVVKKENGTWKITPDFSY